MISMRASFSSFASLLLASALLFACASEPVQETGSDSSNVETVKPIVGVWRTKTAPFLELALSKETNAPYTLTTCKDLECRDRGAAEAGTYTAERSRLLLSPKGARVDAVKSRDFVFLVTDANKQLLLETNLPLNAGPSAPIERFDLARSESAAGGSSSGATDNGSVCGTSVCPAGKSCCNPLTGACTAPDEICLL